MNEFIAGFCEGFRRGIWRWFALPVAVVAAVVSTVFTLGVTGLLGLTVTGFLILTILLILTVGVADSVHALTGYTRLDDTLGTVRGEELALEAGRLAARMRLELVHPAIRGDGSRPFLIRDVGSAAANAATTDPDTLLIQLHAP